MTYPVIIDLSAAWQTHPERRHGGKGIRTYVPEWSPRDPSEVDSIVLHQWAAEVSIGKEARARVAAGETSYHEELAQRAISAPYHYSVGTHAGRGLVVKAWPALTYTNHAGSRNRHSLGIGVMGLWPQLGGEARDGLAEALQWALRDAAAEIQKAHPGPVRLETHSQTARKPADPGEWIVRSGVLPLVRAGVLRVDPTWSERPGSPWPPEWR